MVNITGAVWHMVAVMSLVHFMTIFVAVCDPKMQRMLEGCDTGM